MRTNRKEFLKLTGMAGLGLASASILPQKILIKDEGNNSKGDFVSSYLNQSTQETSGGVFIPRNGGYDGLIGGSHAFFDHDAGGVMSVVIGKWPRFKHVAKLDMIFAIKTSDSKRLVQVRQSFDKDPQILFLEEGNSRIGLRVLFNLYDPNNNYYGYGMTESWIHPDGQIFITAAATFEKTAVLKSVSEGRLEIDIPKELRAESIEDINVAMNDTKIPTRHIFLISPEPNHDKPGLSLYWRTGRMEHNTYIYRSSFGKQGAPTYFRWPDYFRQAHTQPTTLDYVHKKSIAPWPPGRGAWISKIVSSDKGVQLKWPIGKQPNSRATFNTLFRLAMVGKKSRAKAFVEAEREPVVKMNVTGGVIHGNKKPPYNKGYNDQEGAYEIRKTGTEPVVITLPADPLERTARIKAIALSEHGAVTITLDGKALVPQLSSDGGIADDPLAPIHEPPEAPANAALVTVKLIDKPQEIVVKEEEGIQFVYQSRDQRRNFMVYSTQTGPRWAGLKFSLIDGHARRMRSYGKQDWALTENILHWFAWMGYTPEQMLNQLRDFVIIKNGPDEIIFKYTSNNANNGAQSEYIVRIPADSQAMKINVNATFTVLEQWPYRGAQFFDAFPFRGVRPEDWWYNHVLWLSPEGKWKTYDTVRQTTNGDKNLERLTGPGFFALYSSDRGNMLMLTKSEVPTDYIVCGNYIDFHMKGLLVGPHAEPVNKGYQYNAKYELAIWGDETQQRDELIRIGKQSLKAGKLVIPLKI